MKILIGICLLFSVFITYSSNRLDTSIIVGNNSPSILIKDTISQNGTLISYDKPATDELFFGISKDLLATIIIPLTIFIVGGCVKFAYDKIKERKLVKDFRKTIFSGIKLNADQIKSNIENINELKEKISNSEDLQPEALQYSPTVGFEKLNSIDIEKYITNFVLESRCTIKPDLKQEEANKLINSINYLALSESIIKNEYNRYNELSYKIFNEYNDLYTDLINHYEDKNRANEEDTSLYESLGKIINQYTIELSKDNNKLKNATILNEYLIIPIEQEILKNKYIDVTLRRIITRLRILQRTWESYKLNFPELFSKIKDNIENSYTKLNESVEYFETNAKIENAVKMLKWGGYINILIAIAHVVGLFFGGKMYDYTGVGENMRRNAEIHPYLPTLITLFVAVVFFIFGLYGLSGAGVIKKKLPLLKFGIFAIAVIYLGRGLIGAIINVGFESSFQWHHLLFWLCAFVVGLLYLMGGLSLLKK